MQFLLPPLQNRIIVLLIAAAVDLLIGDPHRLWHPVQGIGTLISAFEKVLRRLFAIPPRREGQEERDQDFAIRERIAGPKACCAAGCWRFGASERRDFP